MKERTPPLPYRDPQAVLREWLEYLRVDNPRLDISDGEVARLTNLSRDVVQEFRATNRALWGHGSVGRKRTRKYRLPGLLP